MSVRTGMTFGLDTGYCGGMSVQKAISRLAGLGCEEIEVTRDHIGPEILSGTARLKAGLKRIRTAAHDAGVAIRQVHGPFTESIIGNDKNGTNKSIDNFRRWVDCCAALGAACLVVHPGGQSDRCALTATGVIRDLNVYAFSELAEHARGTSVRIAVENVCSECASWPGMISRFGQKIAHLREIVRGAAPGSLGICLDTGHANIEGLDVAEAIEECGDMLIATHIHDNDGIRDLHVFPFAMPRVDGGIDWVKVMRAFRHVGYSRGYIGEIFDHGAPAKVQDAMFVTFKGLWESL